MDYKETFSYCLKDEIPESKHQFHYQCDFEPSEFEFEQWLIGKLYSINQLEKVGVETMRSKILNGEIVVNDNELKNKILTGKIVVNDTCCVTYDFPIEKEKQIHSFLDFHFSKYKSSLANFNLSLNLALKLLKSSPNIKTSTLHYNGINGFIADWISRKIDNRTTIESKKSMNFSSICSIDKIEELYVFLNGSYLSEISDKNHFYYIFGIVDSCTDFKALNWTKTLKDLNAFINIFYMNEPRKWEKAIYCFTCNNNPIKKKSLSTAIDKYDNDPESSIYFNDLYDSLK